METSAKFEIASVFELPSRKCVVLVGRVSAGIIRPGMSAFVLLDGGLFWSLLIKSVEFVDGPGKLSQIGLTIQDHGAEECELLRDLCPMGTVVEVKVSSER